MSRNHSVWSRRPLFDTETGDVPVWVVVTQYSDFFTFSDLILKELTETQELIDILKETNA